MRIGGRQEREASFHRARVGRGIRAKSATAGTTMGKACVTGFENAVRMATPALHNHGASRGTLQTLSHALTSSRTDLPSLVVSSEIPLIPRAPLHLRGTPLPWCL